MFDGQIAVFNRPFVLFEAQIGVRPRGIALAKLVFGSLDQSVAQLTQRPVIVLTGDQVHPLGEKGTPGAKVVLIGWLRHLDELRKGNGRRV